KCRAGCRHQAIARNLMQALRAATTWIRHCTLAPVMLLAVQAGGASDSVAAEPLPARDGGSVERGRLLIDRYQCGACHTIPGVPLARGTAGPPLAQFGRRSYIAGKIPNTEASLAKWIVSPHSLVSNTAMPSMGVTPDDARDMAAYLRSLR